MIHYVEGDLLTYGVEGIIHQCNCFHCMGGGIAKTLASLYPEIVLADKRTGYADALKLGTMVPVQIKHPKVNTLKYVFNVYGQYDMGTSTRHTLYDKLEEGLRKVKAFAIHRPLESIGIPYGLGCGLAGGSWKVVSKIIEDVFKDAPFPLFIVKLAERR